jgi:pimeloyl-ACP methyl ester carboxylesterase
LELALRRPGRLEALVLQGVGARFERGLLQQVAGAVLSRYPLPDNSPFINQFFNLLFGGRQKPGPLFEFVTRQCWQTDQGVMAHRFHLVEPFDIGERGSRLTIPVLAMAGDRDLLVSTRSLEDLGKALPAAQTLRLARSGHLAFVTHPDRVAQEAAAFLRTAVNR